MEEKTNHFVVNSLLLFDTRLDVGRLKELLRARLGQFPRFQQVVVEQAVGRPLWRDDTDFDLEAHVHVLGLPAPGGKEALEELVGDLTSQPLDPGRPLWQLYVVEGPGDGSALLSRIHHSIGDGMALMRVMLALTDLSAEPQPAVRRARARRRPEPSLAGSVLRGIQRTLADPIRMLGVAAYLAESAYVLARLTFLPAERESILRGQLGTRKRVAWSEPIAVEDVRRIGRTADATLNDVLLAAVAGSLRHYSRNVRRPLPAARVTVPYNLRPIDRAGALGNGFSLVYVDLPVGEPDPHRRLLAVRHAMRRIKASPEPWVTFAVLNSVGVLPVPLQKLAINFFGSKASAVITNVPGPEEVLYLAGRPIRQALFWEPESAGIGLGVSIFSYAGEVVVGVIADAGRVPDPRRIVAEIPNELSRLTSPARRPAARARRARPAHRRLAAA